MKKELVLRGLFIILVTILIPISVAWAGPNSPYPTSSYMPPVFNLTASLSADQNTLTYTASSQSSGFAGYLSRNCGPEEPFYDITGDGIADEGYYGGLGVADPYRMSGGTATISSLSQTIYSSNITQTTSGTVGTDCYDSSRYSEGSPYPDPGEPADFTVTKTMDVSSLPAGSHTLSVTLCTYGSICSTKTASIYKTVVETEPDLSAGSISPTTAVLSQPLNFSGLISNTGQKSTNSSFYNYFQLSNSANGGGPWSQISVNSTAALSGNSSRTVSSSSHTFWGVGTYSVRVCADANSSWAGSINESDEYNNCGPWTNITVQAPDLTADEPTQTSATVGNSFTFSSVIRNIGNYTTGSSFYNYFQLSNSANGGGPWSAISVKTTTTLGAGSSRTIYSDPFAFGSPGTYSIRACADANSSWVGSITESNEGNNCSGWVNITVVNPPPSSYPLNLTATPSSCGTGQINISWSSVSYATNYKLYDGTTLIYDGSATSYSHAGLSAGSSHSYRVMATNSSGSSSLSPYVYANAPAVCVSSTPTGLTATPSSCGTGTINISWNASSGATSYQLYDGATLIYNGSATSYSHTGLSAGSSHSYRIRSSNSSGSSSLSSYVYANAPLICAPATPTGLTVTPSSCGTGQINVSWNASSGATSYQLRDGSTIIYDGSGTSYSHTGLSAGSSHSYTVRATNSSGSSSYSASISGSAPSACPTTPTLTDVDISSLTVRADGSTQYTITVIGSDVGGGSKITHEYAMINQGGSNAGNYRGYLTWYYNSGYTGWDALKDKKVCAGGGVAAIQNSYGPTYLNLDSCSTSVSGNNRTTIFTVRFDPSFTSPLTNNDISGYIRNSDANLTGWQNVDINFALAVMSGTLSGSNCTIASGASSCSSSLSWSIVYPESSPTAITASGMTNINVSTSLATPQSGPQTVTVPYSSRTFYLYNNAKELASKTLTATCASGTAWDGSKCLALAPTPTGLSASASTCGTGRINVSWNASSGATSYQLRAKDNSTGSETQIYSGSGTSYSHTGLTAGGSYSYRVRATNSAGSSSYSSYVTTTAPADCVEPTASISAGTNPVNYNTASTLTWSCTNSTSATVKRSNGTTFSTALTGNNVSTGALTSAETYTLTCSNSTYGTSDTASVSIGVKPGATLTANPNPVEYNTFTDLSATCTYATSAVVRAPDGTIVANNTAPSKTTVTTSGPTPNLTSNTTYTLTCTNNYGTSTKSVTVTVNTTATVTVTSNIATTWTLTGPTPQTQSTNITSKTYSSQTPGTYTLSGVSDKAGYTKTISPVGSQAVGSAGSITFNIQYIGIPGEGAVGCVPSSQSAFTGQTTNFSAEGGSGTFSWSAPGGSPSTGGNSSTFSTVYNTEGSKTVTVNRGTDSHSCTISVTTAPPDYSLSKTGDIAVPVNAVGDVVGSSVVVVPINGFNSNVDLSVLSVSPAISGASYSFSPNPVPQSSYSSGSVLTINFSEPAAQGSHTITVQGIGNGIGRTVNINVNISTSGEGGAIPPYKEF